MTEIEQGIIAWYRPANPTNIITILLGDDWAVKVERVWKDRKVERFAMNIIDHSDNESKRFECGPMLYEQIKTALEPCRTGRADKATIIITKDGSGLRARYNVAAVVDPPKVRLKRKLRNWFRK
jgi:hypothetical protein